MQAFLVFDIFIAGAVAAVALRHAYAHFRPHTHEPEHKAPAGEHLPPAVREHLLQEAQINFESVLKSATRDLQKDLQATADDIKEQLEKMGEQARQKELEHYKATLAELQSQTNEDIGTTEKELAVERAELKAKLKEEVEAEKKRLLAAIDTKLADAVTSFLLETLQHDVDLGAQTAYITKMLDEHKADFAREVAGEEG